jgi:hypothetical protein
MLEWCTRTCWSKKHTFFCPLWKFIYFTLAEKIRAQLAFNFLYMGPAAGCDPRDLLPNKRSTKMSLIADL